MNCPLYVTIKNILVIKPKKVKKQVYFFGKLLKLIFFLLFKDNKNNYR